MENDELHALLMLENSRANTDFVGNIVKKKPELIHALWEIYLSDRGPLSRRAAWIIDTASENEPSWVEPYLETLIDLLPTFGHDGMKRHGLRMISRNPLPENRLGELTNLSFEWLLSKSEAVAAKMYYMLILFEVSKQMPQISNELIDTIEFQMSEGSPGFKSIGKKILKQLYKNDLEI
ncbi:MAG: hypothetical protein IPH84_00230 [Bacteroidales bacterium]|nr:hypothetical protein [Bacteroidales bacterium]